jgi:very-short-patch-repair endonuclease
MSFSERNQDVFSKLAPQKIVRARSLRQKMSLPEVMIWQRLRPKVNKDFHLRRQVPLLGKYTVDFYFGKLKVVFEIDGSIHALKGESDRERDRTLKQAGISVVRIAARSVLANPDGVSDFIRRICLGEINIQDIE